MVTVKTLFIAPKAKPTQDSTKEFTPRVETFTARDWDHTRELPRQPVRTEVGLKLEHFLARRPLSLGFKFWIGGFRMYHFYVEMCLILCVLLLINPINTYTCTSIHE